MSAPTVSEALRRFMPEYLSTQPVLSAPQCRALWAMQACRTPALGGRGYRCAKCSRHHFAYHSCNHKACPQCGREATRKWVQREQRKLIGAPYFMVTFTLPSELRELFFGKEAKAAYDLFFAAASRALSDKLAASKWLGAKDNGFTMVLHTWNQKMLFHPHLHCIVPGAGLDAKGDYRAVKSAQFLVPVPVLSKAFRAEFRAQMQQHGWQCDPAVWRMDWGVHVQACGSGENIVKYLGTYVARSVIADSRILSISDTHVTFRYKDRDDGGAVRTLKVEGKEFVRRYLRHVLPRGLRSVRYYGWCHPAAKKTRLKVTALSGRRIELGAEPAALKAAPHTMKCPCCQQPMELRSTFKPLPLFFAALQPRGPPQAAPSQA